MEHSTYSRVVRDKVSDKISDKLYGHHAMHLSTFETIMYALPFILVPNLIGIAGAFATRPRLESWYKNLRKPWFTPPNWIFSVVWPCLYTMIGYATFLVWRDTGGFFTSGGRMGLFFSVVNIILNGLWSPVFFGFGLISLAFLLHLAIYATAWLAFFGFLKISTTAAVLYFPYLCWLTYAGALQLWMVMYSSSPAAEEQRAKHGVSSSTVNSSIGGTGYRAGGPAAGESTVSKRTTVTSTAADVSPRKPGF